LSFDDDEIALKVCSKTFETQGFEVTFTPTLRGASNSFSKNLLM